MKYLNYLIGFLTVLILLSFIITSPNDKVANEFNQLGNVQYSILPPDDFKKENGDGWALLNRRDISNSALGLKYGIESIPDGNGRFIRIIDIERDTILRIDKDRKFDRQAVGDVQSDATKIPLTNFVGITTSSDPHEHDEDEFATADGTGLGLGGGDGKPTNLPGLTKGGGHHVHNVLITGGGDYETRPQNIILYAYIKIN